MMKENRLALMRHSSSAQVREAVQEKYNPKQADYATDITFVEVQDFKYQVPCFNATVPEFDLPSNGTGSAQSTPTAGGSSDSGGLSGGVIAGIVIGTIAGVAILSGAAFFIWRLRNQRERLRAQEASVSAVKWDQAERPSTTPSDNDVALRDLSTQRD